MMHEHDTDLIMALAEGTLDATRTATVAAEIAACSECADELAMQRTAVAALRAAPPAAMNDIERARVRRTVRDELGIAAARVETRPRDARRFRLFAGLATAAAVLVAFVVIAPSLDLLGGDDDAADSFDIAFGAETTQSGNDTRALTQSDGSEEAPTAEGIQEAIEAAPTTAASPATTSAAPADILAGGEATFYQVWASLAIESLPDLTELATAILEAGSLEAVLGPQDLDVAARLDVIDEERCLLLGLNAAPGSTDAYIVGLSGINDVEVVLVAYVTGQFDAVTVLAHDLETCKILATSG